MRFVTFSNEGARPTEQPYITCDKQGRIYINRLAQKKMDALELPTLLYLSYNSDEKAIGITKDEEVAKRDSIDGTAKPFRFNGSRAYASAKTLLMQYRILPRTSEDAHRYFYEGYDNGWHSFLREGVEAAPVEDVAKGQTSLDDYEEEQAAASEPVVVESDSPTAPLTEKEAELLAVINEKPNLTHREYGEIVGVKKNTVTKRITSIKSKGYSLPIESR
jgi:hypothetical protein